MFQSDRFRRDLNQQLTELVIKEIQKRTPYKVVSGPEDADYRLEGRIVFDDKTLMVENPNNLPRQLLSTISASVTYVDNRAGRSYTRNTPPTMFSQNENFYPEIGQTAGIGFRRSLEKMAVDIVNAMEDPWSDSPRAFSAPPTDVPEFDAEDDFEVTPDVGPNVDPKR
jgi:hypothetical protein